MKDDWSRYSLRDYAFTSFAPGTSVLDIGCGNGKQLQALAQRGCRAVGVEPKPDLVNKCNSMGLNVVQGWAEKLPFQDESFEGIICKVVMPFTAESVAFREIARVLRPGGTARMCYQGIGFYLRYLMVGPGLKLRFYGLRTLVNTWVFGLTRRVLPKFLGDSIYQSSRRLRTYYDENNLSLIKETPSPRFLGFRVFVYHFLRAETAASAEQPRPQMGAAA